MAKPKKDAQKPKPVPIHKKTSQGSGRGSKANHGRKKNRGQG